MGWNGKVNDWKNWMELSTPNIKDYPTPALRERARDLPSNVFLIRCRKAGALGKFSYREFEINPEPGEDLLPAFYRHHGQEWECGERYEWLHLHKKELNAVWRYFTR